MPAVISLHGCTRCQRSTDPRLRVAPEGSGEPPVVTSDARPGPGERVAAAAGAATARSVGPRTDRAALAIDAEGSGQRRGWGVDARGTAARSDPGMGASGRRAPECEHVGVPGRRGRVATSTPARWWRGPRQVVRAVAVVLQSLRRDVAGTGASRMPLPAACPRAARRSVERVARAPMPELSTAPRSPVDSFRPLARTRERSRARRRARGSCRGSSVLARKTGTRWAARQAGRAG